MKQNTKLDATTELLVLHDNYLFFMLLKPANSRQIILIQAKVNNTNNSYYHGFANGEHSIFSEHIHSWLAHCNQLLTLS